MIIMTTEPDWLSESLIQIKATEEKSKLLLQSGKVKKTKLIVCFYLFIYLFCMILFICKCGLR